MLEALEKFFEKELDEAEVEDKKALAEDDKNTEKKVKNRRVGYYSVPDDVIELVRENACRQGLVPVDFKKATFDDNKLTANINVMASAKGREFEAVRLNEYKELIHSILGTVRAGELPDRSYLIGAPNGYGKQSFATDCIVASILNGWRTVPYVSLNEIAEIKAENDKSLLRGLMAVTTRQSNSFFNYATGQYQEYDNTDDEQQFYGLVGSKRLDIKQPEVVVGSYSWSEYINAPLLVTFFSGIEGKDVESRILETLLNIRAAKGFVTIVFISTSLDPYLNGPTTGRYVWFEILNHFDTADKSRLTYMSTFKKYKGAERG